MSEYRISKYVSIHQVSEDKTLVSNRATGKSYELGWKESIVLNLIDGKNSPEIISALCGFYSDSEVIHLEDKFEELGLIEHKGTKHTVNLFKIKFPIFSPDLVFKDKRVINSLYYILTYCSLIAVMLSIPLSIFHAMFGTEANRMTMISNFVPQNFMASAVDVMIIYAIVTLSFFLHEFAHMITAKHYGISVPDMGFMLYLLIPCAYTNLTFLNFSKSDKIKLHVLSAGLFADLGVTGYAILLFHFVPFGYISKYFLYTALFGMVSAFGNLIIFFKFDGYFILEILLQEANLKQVSLQHCRVLLLAMKSTFYNRDKKVKIWATKNCDSAIADAFNVLFTALTISYVPMILGSGFLSLIVWMIGELL